MSMARLVLSLPACLQRNLWAALPEESAEARMRDRKSFAATNIVSLAGDEGCRGIYSSV